MAFWKRKLKRIQLDKSRSPQENGGLSERDTVNLLLGCLFAVIILGALGTSYLVNITQTLTTLAVITLLVTFWSAYLIAFHQTDVLASYLKVFLFGLLTSAPLLLLKIFIVLNWSLLFLPSTFISMLIALGYSRRVAIINLLFQSLFVWLLVESQHQAYYFIHLPGSIIAALGMTNIRTRANLIKLGGLAGISHFIIISAHVLIRNNQPEIGETFRQGFLGLVNGLISGFIVLGILPFLERWFQILTDQSLLELADLNHPLLKELSLKAPGTYHHSLRLSNLAEAATESIKSNALLSRVGSYYHDIGKLNKPGYFIENEPLSVNKHQTLTPSMSTLVITAHVKDGVELGHYHKLPIRLLDFIGQHHGTSIVKYFYHVALQNNEPISSGERTEPEITEDSFRYPGPKPQTKEVAIVLLADSVEAASRTLEDITPAKLEGLVHEVIMEKLLDGQLDESNLTMKELKLVEESFIRVLVSIFHPRIKYPE